jgi:putative ABC transport system permease protein
VQGATADEISDARAQVAQAQAGLDAMLEAPDAEAQVIQAQAELDALLAGTLAKDLAAAKLNVEQAQLDLDSAQRALAETQLVAPFAGMVVGVMASKGIVGNTDYDGRGYIRITTLFAKFRDQRFGRDAVCLVYVSAESKETMDSVMAQLPKALYGLLGTDSTSPGFTLTTQENIIDAQTSTTEPFRSLLGWVAAISLLVGGIGIMNIMLVNVTERTRGIGLRQALGARPRDVRLQFLLEAIVLSLVGGLLGVLAGAGGSYLFSSLGTMRTELVPASIPLAFAAAAAVGIFFGYYPPTKATQPDPIEALRREQHVRTSQSRKRGCPHRIMPSDPERLP